MTRFQAIQAQHNGVDQGQHHLGDGIAAVAPGITQLLGENMSQLQHLQEFAKEIHATEVREASMITGDSEVSRRSAHSDTYFTKS